MQSNLITSRPFFKKSDYVIQITCIIPSHMWFLHDCHVRSCSSWCLQYPLVIIMLARGEIFQLINFASFSRWLFIAMATLGMIIHRYRFPEHPRPFKVHLDGLLIEI